MFFLKKIFFSIISIFILTFKIYLYRTLKCPRCSQAFIDYDNCSALTCSRCRCGFCAYCQTDCGNDAHKHVANCKEGNGAVYIDFNGFIQVSNNRRRKRILEFFNQCEINNPKRNEILDGLKTFLIPHLETFKIKI